MTLNEFRNFFRTWVQTQLNESSDLSAVSTAWPNQTTNYGTDAVWLRYSLQTGQSVVLGVGAETLRRRRVARCFIEVFGPRNVGEGQVSRLATAAEELFRAAMPAEQAPDPLISVLEPYTFERSEPDRYCQVVSVPLQVDTIG